MQCLLNVKKQPPAKKKFTVLLFFLILDKTIFLFQDSEKDQSKFIL